MLDDELGISGHVLAHMSDQNLRKGGIEPARGDAHVNLNGLSLVEILDGIRCRGPGASKRQDGAQRRTQQAKTTYHGDLPL